MKRFLFSLMLATMALALSSAPIFAADPNPGHSASSIGPGTNGTFAPGNYTFPENLGANGTFTLGGDGNNLILNGDTNPNTINSVGNNFGIRVNGASGFSISTLSTIFNSAIDVQDYNLLVTNATGANTLFIVNASSGNVAINTTTPTQLLDVRGNANVSGTFYTAQLCLNGVCQTSWPSSGSGLTNSNNSAGNVPRFSNTTNLATGSIYDNGTAVGIGTSTPSTQLHLNGSGAFDVTLLVTNNMSNGLAVGVDDDGGAFFWNTEETEIAIATNNTERVRILADGKIGIGTINPAEEFEFQGERALFNGVMIGENTGGFDTIEARGASGLILAANDFTSQLVLDMNGRFGVNTSSPQYALDVNGSANISRILYTPQLCLNGVCQTSWPSSGSGLTNSNNSAGNVPRFTNTTNLATGALYDNGAGKIGVNSLLPNSALDVNGSIQSLINGSLFSRIGTVTYNSGENNGGAIVVGRYAYHLTSTAPANLVVVDVSNPSSPARISSLALSSGEDYPAFTIAGKYAYIATYTNPIRFVVVDISNPNNPVRVGNITLTGASNVQSIAQAGKYVYVGTGEIPAKVVVVDVSNPQAPQTTGSVTLSTTENYGTLAALGSYAYVATDTNPIQVVVVNASNPYTPTRLGNTTLNTGETNGYSVLASGRYLYITTWTTPARIVVVDISNPQAPTRTAALTLGTGEDYGRSTIAGRYLFTTLYTTPGKLVVTDINNPAAPIRIANYTLGTGEDTTTSISVSGKYAYITTGTTPAKLLVVELPGIEAGTATFGSTETGQLQVRQDLRVSNDASISGSLSVGTTLRVDGDVGIRNITISGTLNSTIIATPQLCLNGNCRTSWPSGSGNVTSNNGTAGYIGKFTNSTNIATGAIYDDGTSIGIGTTLPFAKLSLGSMIGNGISLNDSVAPNIWFFEQDAPTNEVGWRMLTSNGQFLLSPSDSLGNVYGHTAMRIDRVGAAVNSTVFSNGSFGINNSYPNATLHVVGDAIISTSIATPQLCLNGSCQTSWPSGTGGNTSSTNGTAGYIGRFTNSTNIATGTIYDNGTAIGIGKTSLSARLDVSGPIKTDQYFWTDSGGYGLYHASNSGVTMTSAASTYGTLGTESNHQLTFFSNNVERVYIRESGRVGINNSNPLHTLDITGTANVSSILYTPQLCLNGTCRTSWPAGNITSNNGTAGYIGRFTNSTNIATGAIYDNGSGSIGIGTTTPGARLEVIGDIISTGTSWTAQTAPRGYAISSLTYGNGIFVATLSNGTSGLMVSSDGVNWTLRTAPELNAWGGVTYGNGLFVAVASNGTNRIMTSPDGVVWNVRTAPEANTWGSVAYGNGTFVAVSGNTTNAVMTSPDGITWTLRNASEANAWGTVEYFNGLFIAGADTGTNRIMTSPDGYTWTSRSLGGINIRGITYGNGMYVVVASSGEVYTSPDTITWTARTAASSNAWRDVEYGNGLFVAVASSGTNRIMTSPDGITWTARAEAETNTWLKLTYGNGMFVAGAINGTNPIMTSGKQLTTPRSPGNSRQGGMQIYGDVGINTSTPTQALDVRGNVNVSSTVYASQLSLQNGTINATGTELRLLVNEDTFGSVGLRLQNRQGANGALFEQLNSSIPLIDFIFRASTESEQATIRYEERNAYRYLDQPEFQIGDFTGHDAPNLIIGRDNGTLLRQGNFALGYWGAGGGSNPATHRLSVNGSANISDILYTPQICLNGSCQTSWPSGNISANQTSTGNFTIFGNATNIVSAALSDNGTTIIIARHIVSYGGNARGLYATDLQTVRPLSSEVASGEYSVIAGGRGNTASGSFSTVSGGGGNSFVGNTASGYYSTVSGGGVNTASGNYSIAAGGLINVASGSYSGTIGGLGLAAQGFAQTAIGQYNIANGTAGNIGANDLLFIVGNGTTDIDRNNAFAVSNNGTTIAGAISTASICLNGVCQTSWPNGNVTSSNGTSNALAVFTNSTSLNSTNIYYTFSTGRVGIGVSNPGEKLSVSGNINATGSINAAAGVDLAEAFEAIGTIEAAEIVAVPEADPTGDRVELASAASAYRTIGVVSTQPGMTLNKQGLNGVVYVAIAGRVPVKVTGTVRPGDFITPSNTPGQGKAATEASFTIGRALTADNNGKVVVLIQPGYFNPAVTEQGSLVGGKAERTTFEDKSAVGEALKEGSLPALTGAITEELQTKEGDDVVVALGTPKDVVITLG